RVRIAGAYDFGQPYDGRRLGAAVIEEHLLADGDLVPEEVASLKVPDPFPARAAVTLEIVYGIAAGLALEQPVSGHGLRFAGEACHDEVEPPECGEGRAETRQRADAPRQPVAPVPDPRVYLWAGVALSGPRAMPWMV